MESQSRELHSDSRSPRPRTAESREVPSRANDWHWIDARMLREVFVFELHGRPEQRR